MSLLLRAVRADRSETDSLPSPPDDREKYWYIGRQHRWLLFAQAASFALIAYSVARFATAFPPLILFLVPTSLYAVTLVVSLLSSARKKRVTRENHESLVSSWVPDRYPSVDVFLPTAGEPLEVLANTYKHVALLRWRGEVNVYVLDDGAREEVRELAQSYSFTYSVRPNRGYLKKAGNLRHGFEMSRGDFIAIFDADFVPRWDYFDELIPYFDDPTVGIVQSPQFFDAKRGMHWLQRCAGATQELFYRFIQPARDKSRAAICVGTCAIYRREGLNKSGGFAQIGHSEDVHTGVNLMRVGYFVQYVPILVAKGICPSDLSSYLNQQYRWCTGSMSLLADKNFHNNPLLRLRQRLCFWAGFLYYISTGLNAFVAPLPGLVMLYLLPHWIQPLNSIWLTAALLLWLVVVPVLFKSRWRVDVLRVQSLYSFAHAVAIFHVLTGRTQEWVATGAVQRTATPLGTQITRVMRVYVTLTLALVWFGLVRDTIEFGIQNLWAMDLLGVLASYIQIPMLLLRVPHPARRRARDVVSGFLRTVPWLARPRRRSGVTLSPIAAPFEEPTVAKSPQAPGARKFRPDIQGLRAVAVLMVVLYHANVPGLTGGFAGVDVFFVISGFLITGQITGEVLRTGRFSFKNFYAGRVRRLLPSALLVILATVIADRFFDSLLRATSVASDGLFATFYAVNYRLAAAGVNYQQATAPPSPLQHFWSLAVEEQFYLIWPVLLVLAAVVFRRSRRVMWGLLIATVFAASLYLSATLTNSNAPLAYFSAQTRAWELAAGAGLALLAPPLAKLRPWMGAVLSWSGLVAILTSLFIFNNDTKFPGLAALLPVLGAAALIAGGGQFVRGGAESVLGLRLFQTLGKYSYGWYLWHWPLVVLAQLILNKDLSWQENLEIMAIALWLAVLSYHLVESPSARARWKQVRWLGIGGVASASTAIIALVIVLTVPSLVGSGGAVKAASLTNVNLSQLQYTLGRALDTKNAPSNLTPSLSRAQYDQPISTFDGCHADFLVVNQPTCVFGDVSGTHTVVLFGDSHAQQWLPALNVVAQQKHWRLIAWTKAACPVATNVTLFSAQLKRNYTECDAWRTQTMKRIDAAKPDLIVMSQSDNVPGTQVSNTRWADQTAETASVLNSSAAPVIYLLDTPIPGTDAPSCVAAHIDNVSACNRATSRAFTVPGRHAAVAAALTQANVQTIDPLYWFCTKAACPMVVENKLVYRDTTHMSTAYSEWLAPELAGLLATSSN